MRHTKKVVFFIFILIAVISAFINIIYINSTTAVNAEAIEKLDGIYFNPKKMDKQGYTQLAEILNSHNEMFFKTLLTSRNPVFNFYGFCGLMKGDQQDLISLFTYNPFISDKNVTIYYKEQTLKASLGYAFLLLLKDTPQWLTNGLSGYFLNDSTDFIYEAFQSNNQSSGEYKNLLIEIIMKHYNDLAKQILTEYKSIDLNQAEYNQKLNIVNLFPYFPAQKKKQIQNTLLLENDREILIKIIPQITTADSQITSQLANIILDKNQNKKVIQLAMDRYALLLKSRSINTIRTLMRSNPGNDILIPSLNIIQKYGNEQQYELLKLYLSNRYAPQINKAALDAIIDTTYWKRTSDVINTLVFVIRNSASSEVAKHAIDFHIKNNLSNNSGLILSRLRQRESEEMKFLALDYLERFKFTSGIWLLEMLAKDSNQQIKDRTQALLKILYPKREIELKNAREKAAQAEAEKNESNIEGDQTASEVIVDDLD